MYGGKKEYSCRGQINKAALAMPRLHFTAHINLNNHRETTLFFQQKYFINQIISDGISEILSEVCVS